MANQFPPFLQAARLRTSKKWPYLNAVLWSLQPVEKPIGTFAVDKYHRLYYDPACEGKWTVEEISGALCHEVYHILDEHHARAECMIDISHHLWNIAGDLAINGPLTTEGVPLPKGCLVPDMFSLPEGLLVEEYYHLLAKQAKSMTNQANGKAAIGQGKCGSVSGSPQPWEDPSSGVDKDGNPVAPAISRIEGELIRRQVALDVQEASKSRGDIPGWLKKWADVKLNPKVDWRKKLTSAIRKTLSDTMGMVDYTYRRPGRRASASPDIVTPHLRMPVPHVAVVLDTSGSMGQGTDSPQEKALCEVAGVLKAAGQQEGVKVYVTDAAVISSKRVFKADQIEVTGGGGTDMRVGISAAMTQRPKPHLIIVVTDGETPWPDVPLRGSKLIVALVGTGRCPEWAEVVNVE